MSDVVINQFGPGFCMNFRDFDPRRHFMLGWLSSPVELSMQAERAAYQQNQSDGAAFTLDRFAGRFAILADNFEIVAAPGLSEDANV